VTAETPKKQGDKVTDTFCNNEPLYPTVPMFPFWDRKKEVHLVCVHCGHMTKKGFKKLGMCEDLGV